MTLSTREKILLLVFAVLAAGTVIYFLGVALQSRNSDLDRKIRRQQALLAKITTLNTQLDRVKKSRPRANVRRPPLIGHIEQLAARVTLKDRIQLNQVPRERTKGMQGIDIKLDNLTLDEMMEFIYVLENSGFGIVVDQLDITWSFRSKKLLRLSMRVLSRF